MGRAPRVDVGGEIHHVINRGNFRSRLFGDAAAYDDFMGIASEALPVAPMRILAYCLMPNHWHMVLRPERDSDLSRFLHWITLTHTQRYHAKTETRGYGHIYQGRYKSFPVENDRYFLAMVRYVERNAKRAALVERSEDWRWSSAYVRTFGSDVQRKLLSPWPMEAPDDYLAWLNESQPKEEIENIRYNIRRSRPYGSERWTADMVNRFGLEATVRNPWRPKKGT
jgi:putative transposase